MLPSVSYDAPALNVTVCPTSADEGVAVNEATGGWFAGATTVTVWLVDAVAPALSCTVRVTVNVPADEKECAVDDPLLVPPSPKFHDHETTLPSGSWEPVPLNEMLCPTYAGAGE